MPKAYKASNGRRVYYRCAVRLPDGSRKWIRAKTKREAEEKAAEEEKKLQLGLDPDARRETVSDFMGRFLEFIKPGTGSAYSVAPSTYQDYRYHVTSHILPALGMKRVCNLTTRDVDQLLNAKSDSGLSSTTVRYAHSVLRRALNFAVDWGVIERNPASSRMRTAKRRKSTDSTTDRIRALTPEQCERLLTGIRGDRHCALIVTALTTGARPGELLALQWRDVDLRSNKISIQRALHRTKRKKGESAERWILRPPKTSGSRRMLILPPITAEALRTHAAEQESSRKAAGGSWEDGDFVFASDCGSPLDISNVLHHFQRVCRSLGLPKLRFYDLRHTHASLLIAQGMHPKLIAERLGHSSIKLTMDTYGHLFEGSDSEAANAMQRLFGQESEPVVPNVTPITSSKRR
jgi:integrase